MTKAWGIRTSDGKIRVQDLRAKKSDIALAAGERLVRVDVKTAKAEKATGMKGRAYEAAIKKIGLSQRKAGPFLGFGERQSRRIVAGEAELPGGAEKLLKLMLKRGITAAALLEEIGE